MDSFVPKRAHFGFHVRLCILYFLFLSLIGVAILTYASAREAEKSRADYYSALSDSCSKLSDSLEEVFSSAVRSCNTIFSLRWYKHYRNVAGIYGSEFTVPVREEVSCSLAAMCPALDCVTDILVITPALDSVITSLGWYTITNYERIYGLVDIHGYADATEYPLVTPVDPGICAITLRDPTVRLDKSVICVLIDRKKTARMIERMTNGQMNRVSVAVAGQSLYESGAENPRDIAFSYSYAPIRLAVNIRASTYESVMARQNAVQYIKNLFILLFSTALTALLFTRLSSMPIRKLLSAMPEYKPRSEDPYGYISEYLKRVSVTNRELKDENETLNDSIHRFVYNMKNEILYGILSNPDFDFSDDYATSGIPCVTSGLPCVLALLSRGGAAEAGEGPDDDSLSKLPLHFMRLNTLSNESVLFFWFPGIAAANAKIPEIIGILERGDRKYSFAVSSPILSPEKIRDTYMNLKSEMRRKYEERNNSLLSRQTELIYYLKLGKKEQCLSILRECSKSYAPDSFLPLLADVADGCDFSAEEYSARFERLGVAGKTRGQWDMLADMADEICGITGTKRTDMDELAALICQYIEENCSDPNMSVTLLTQQFAVSRDLVSKLIRLYKNQTFCDYLLELRMHRAFELLGQTDLSISTIAEAVGYTSYTSFKRAFIRYKGISPREYRVAAESARTR